MEQTLVSLKLAIVLERNYLVDAVAVVVAVVMVVEVVVLVVEMIVVI